MPDLPHLGARSGGKDRPTEEGAQQRQGVELREDGGRAPVSDRQKLRGHGVARRSGLWTQPGQSGGTGMLADAPLLPTPRTSSSHPTGATRPATTHPLHPSTKALNPGRRAWAVMDHWFQTTFLASWEPFI